MGDEDDNKEELPFSGNFRYLILKPHNGGIRDLARFLINNDRLSGEKFIQTSDDVVIREEFLGGDDDVGETPDHRWVIFVSILVRKIIAVVGKPMEWTGYLVEFILNFITNNGGFLGLLYNILHGKLVLPQRGSETFISAIGHLDGRIDLYKGRSVDEAKPLETAVHLEIGSRSLMDLCIMASKLAYENALVVKNVVDIHWKMHFVDFYDCWNGKARLTTCVPSVIVTDFDSWSFQGKRNRYKIILKNPPDESMSFEKENSTQVFILCDKPKDANLILISFRGTEPFDADDWSTDFDYSWYEIPKLGKVHMGFLEALGLGSRVNAPSFQENLLRMKRKSTNLNGADVTTSTSEESDMSSTIADSDTQGGSYQSSDSEQPDKVSEKVLAQMVEKTAYYAVRSKLINLLEEHKNAKFVVTGHSLGGALAILFPVVLVLHKEEQILQRLLAVYTYGQPRVGNRKLGRFMESHLDSPVPKYFRVVYCNDLVPRLPYDNKTFLYKHFGACLYYNSLYIEQKVEEEPNRNYFGFRFLLPEYLNAVWELIRSFVMGYIYGPQYKEGWESTLLRIVGLGIPGISAHSPVDYVTSVRLGRERAAAIQMSAL